MAAFAVGLRPTHITAVVALVGVAAGGLRCGCQLDFTVVASDTVRGASIKVTVVVGTAGVTGAEDVVVSDGCASHTARTTSPRATIPTA